MSRRKRGGSSDDEQYRGRRKVMRDGDAWDAAVRGSRRKSTSWYQKAKAVLKTHKGDAKRAMQSLGIRDRRTWKRYTNPDPKKRGAPSKENQRKLDQAYNSPDVRRATLPNKRINRFKKKGMKVTITGSQGPAAAGATYERIRSITTQLPPSGAERVMDAFIEGGPDAAKQQLQEEMMSEDGYLSGQQWEFREMTEFKFKDADPDVFDDFDE